MLRGFKESLKYYGSLAPFPALPFTVPSASRYSARATLSSATMVAFSLGQVKVPTGRHPLILALRKSHAAIGRALSLHSFIILYGYGWDFPWPSINGETQGCGQLKRCRLDMAMFIQRPLYTKSVAQHAAARHISDLKRSELIAAQVNAVLYSL